MLIWHKNFSFAKFEYGYQNNAEFYADFETVEKNVKNLLKKGIANKRCEKSEFLLLLLTCKVFGKELFLGGLFSTIISTDLKSA